MSTTYDAHDLAEDLHEADPAEGLEDADLLELDPVSQELVDELVIRIMMFVEELCRPYLQDDEMFPYQREAGMRIIESILINDGETLTLLQSRQSGKTETVANVVSGLMILLPRLAKIFPDLLGKFKSGFMVGTFAPVEDQAETLHARIVRNLTSDHAVEIMRDPEIDDKGKGKGEFFELIRCGSFVRMQTTNPRAKIESKSYHLILVDECQDADEYVINKSVMPMGAFYNATTIMTGTPTTHKGVFYRQIQQNKRRQTKRGRRRNHFEYDWKYCAKFNPNYAKFIRKEMLRIGEDSDEFQLSYALRWLLDRGMFITSSKLDELGDLSMEIVRSWYKTPCLVGVDPARKLDSTVVTVVYVDWDRPDEFGYYDHRVLNWLELHGEDWEEQYYEIWRFLQNYSVWKIGVDSQGVGDAIAQRLDVIFGSSVEVVPVPSDPASQTKRWTHLQELIQRKRVGWPAHAHTRRLKVYKRFYQQMEDLEKIYKGKYMLAAAPEDDREAHDDYPDSLAIATILSKEHTMPEVQTTAAPWHMEQVGTRARRTKWD